MKQRIGIIYYAFAAMSSIFLASGLMVLSGGETIGRDGDI